jgi:hypothetical protein
MTVVDFYGLLAKVIHLFNSFKELIPYDFCGGFFRVIPWGNILWEIAGSVLPH